MALKLKLSSIGRMGDIGRTFRLKKKKPIRKIKVSLLKFNSKVKDKTILTKIKQ